MQHRVRRHIRLSVNFPSCGGQHRAPNSLSPISANQLLPKLVLAIARVEPVRRHAGAVTILFSSLMYVDHALEILLLFQQWRVYPPHIHKTPSQMVAGKPKNFIIIMNLVHCALRFFPDGLLRLVIPAPPASRDFVASANTFFMPVVIPTPPMSSTSTHRIWDTDRGGIDDKISSIFVSMISP